MPASIPDDFRAGFCPIVGFPNVGKSTLLNRLVGRKLGIVTPKAQTTRKRLGGIYTDEGHQVVFVDTPGWLDPRYALQAGMRREAEAALEGADELLYVVDCGFGPSLEAAKEFARPEDIPALLALNKADRVSEERVKELTEEFGQQGWNPVIPTVGNRGEGVDELRTAVLERLPQSPPFYPLDQLSTADMRELTAEFVREACFRELEEEVPYSTAVQVKEYREEDDPLYVSAVIYVERDSQKGIVIGKKGSMIRRIGSRARREIEDLVGRQVYLDLWVKVLSKWRKKPGALARLGLPVPKAKERR